MPPPRPRTPKPTTGNPPTMPDGSAAKVVPLRPGQRPRTVGPPEKKRSIWEEIPEVRPYMPPPRPINRAGTYRVAAAGRWEWRAVDCATGKTVEWYGGYGGGITHRITGVTERRVRERMRDELPGWQERRENHDSTDVTDAATAATPDAVPTGEHLGRDTAD